MDWAANSMPIWRRFRAIGIIGGIGLLCSSSPAPASENGPTPPAATASDRVDPTPDDQAGDGTRGATARTKPPGRIFGLLPNHASVDGGMSLVPFTTGETFRMAALDSFDPVIFPMVGVATALNRRMAGASYGARYATALADNSIGNFMTSAVMPALFHQDSRYVQQGEGGLLRRVGHAASRSVVGRTRSGARTFNAAEIVGNAAAAGISNAYYPRAERSATDTLVRWGMQVMWDTVSNELKEFWPDIRRKLHKP